MKFTIPGRLPSLNQIINSSRSSVYGANAEKVGAQKYIALHVPRFKIKYPCYVLVTFYEPDDRRDVDNIVAGGFKLILDALVNCGVLPNDNRRWVKQITPLVFTDRDNPRIEVEVRPLRVKEGKQ